jgi:hypothetical protein
MNSDLILVAGMLVILFISGLFISITLRDLLTGRYRKFKRLERAVEKFEHEVIEEDEQLFDKGKHL